MTVFGHRLNVIQRPYIYFSLNDSYFSQVRHAEQFVTRTSTV